MLGLLSDSGLLSERKARLFAVACCRRIWEGLRDERSKRAVEVAERFADGRATREELLAAYDMAYSAVDDCLHCSPFSEDQANAACGSASEDAEAAAWDAVVYGWDGDWPGNKREQTTLLRDLFGPLPFRPLPPLEGPVRAWDDGFIVKLATAIYGEPSLPEGHLDNARLAVLADALEEAGCTDPDILGHLRQQGGVHVRGCWGVDWLTGRS
jgi:hypothetical protein